MCCGKARAGAAVWVVTYPDGHTENKPSSASARIAASKVPGATWKAADKT